MEPTFRFAQTNAIKELADELHLPYNTSMQDWSYEVSNPNDIDSYISHYQETTDDDKKFVLMEMILQAIVDQDTEEQLLFYWGKVSPILTDDFRIHEYTVYYWKKLTEIHFENCKTLSPLLRTIWTIKTSSY